MNGYILVPQAEDDFMRAYDYLYFRSTAAASKLEIQLLHAFDHVCDWPESGHLRPELTELPVRFWSAGNHLIVYDPRHKPIRILAILHGAQDIPRILNDRFPTESI
ncbi:MAG TPA: type II toxin-antitoxin system RelE/ParE family toxin [Acidobacteriaceae bacterium]|jgi:plasmid stabilization system protein ParE